jgi:hypothetical protein
MDSVAYMSLHRSDTETIIAALRILSSDIICGDGVATGCLLEAADRMEELLRDNEQLKSRLKSHLESGNN